MNKRIQKLFKKVSWKPLLAFCILLTAVIVFAVIAQEAVIEKEFAVDKMVNAWFLQHSSPAIIQTMRNFSFFGSIYCLFPAYLTIIIIFLFKRKSCFAIAVAAIGLSSYFAEWSLKQLFHRQRPQLPVIKGITGYSFPSGHALSSFVFCSIAAFLIWKGTLSLFWKWLFTIMLFLLTLMVGISRIALNVHYPTDVVAGFCIGIIWVIICLYITTRLKLKV